MGKAHQRRHSEGPALGPPNTGCPGLGGDVLATSAIATVLEAMWHKGQHAGDEVQRFHQLCDSEQVPNLSGLLLFLHELAMMALAGAGWVSPPPRSAWPRS